MAAEPTVPAMEEPLVTSLTMPRGGVHNEEDLGDEGLWAIGAMQLILLE